MSTSEAAVTQVATPSAWQPGTLVTKDNFAQVVLNSRKPCLLVCVASADELVQGSLGAKLQQLDAACGARSGSNTALTLALWNVKGYPDAMASLGIAAESTPVILATTNQQFLDRLVGTAQCVERLDAFAHRFREHCYGAAVAPNQDGQAADNKSMPLNVNKMVFQGQDLLRQGKPFYAQKFFDKSYRLLEALDEHREDANIRGSMALCLSYQIIAMCVQNDGNANESVRKLKAEFAEFLLPGSDGRRAVGLHALCQRLPRGFPAKQSATALRAHLKANPNDVDARSELVVILFLSEAMEELITEVLKLCLVFKDQTTFGVHAMECIVGFLGEDDPLVLRSGWKEIRAREGL